MSADSARPRHVPGGRALWAAVVDVGSLRRRCASAVDLCPAWLRPPEWLEAEILVDRARRWQWLAGRLAARRAIGARSGAGRADVLVLSRDAHGRPAPPRAFAGAVPLPGFLSIAHDGDLAVAVAALAPVGVDLVAPGRLPAGAACRWARDEARFKLEAGAAALAPGPARAPAPRTPGAIVECVTTVRAHVLAICTVREAT